MMLDTHGEAARRMQRPQRGLENTLLILSMKTKCLRQKLLLEFVICYDSLKFSLVFCRDADADSDADSDADADGLKSTKNQSSI
jgi:hypothetical protein